MASKLEVLTADLNFTRGEVRALIIKTLKKKARVKELIVEIKALREEQKVAARKAREAERRAIHPRGYAPLPGEIPYGRAVRR